MVNSLYLGGEELKKLISILLLAGALFIPLTSISAQEMPAAEDPFRTAEQALILTDTAPAVIPASGPSIWAVIRMILTLALAAAAIYGVVFFIKRSGKKTINNDPFLKILATVNLGSNRYAHVVSVGSKAWLLGSSDGGVNLIGEVEDKEVLDAMLLEDSRKSAETAPGRFPDFMSILRRMGTQVETRSPGADDIRRRRERLKGL